MAAQSRDSTCAALDAMAAREHIERAGLQALAGHFFGADAALQEYAEQSIRTAFEDEDDVSELAAALSPFLSPAHDAPALAEALQQLWTAAAEPGVPEVEQRGWEWVRQHEKGEIRQQGRRQQQQQQPQQQQSPGAVAALPSSRGLSVGAAEFQPSCAASANATQAAEELAGLAMGDSGADDWWVGGDEHAAEAAVEATAWQQHDAAYCTADDAAWHIAAKEQQQMWWGAAGTSNGAGNGSGRPLADPDSAGAFLELLVEQFPFYSQESLIQLFEQQGRDPDATIKALFSLEAELAGPAAPPAAACMQQQLQKLREPAFGEQDFPSLCSSNSGGGGGSSRTAETTLVTVGGSSRGWAQVVKSAAALPAPAPSAWGTPAVSVSGGGRSAAEPSPAPIWQARGVQKFDTGSAVAEEYASLRAAARDHARTRNMYFQQARAGPVVTDAATAAQLSWSAQRAPAAGPSLGQKLWSELTPTITRPPLPLPCPGHTSLPGGPASAGKGAGRQGPLAQRPHEGSARGSVGPAVRTAQRRDAGRWWPWPGRRCRRCNHCRSAWTARQRSNWAR